MTMDRILSGCGPGAAGRRVALIALAAAIVGLAGVFTLPPLDRDESRFAQASAQMLESGEFIVIRFQNDERNKKPAGAYWLQAASVAAFSNVEAREIWAYRLPSVLGAVLAAIFTYAAIARLFDPATGVVAALLLAATPVFAAEATIAKTDALLLACTAGSAAAMAHLFGAAIDGRRGGVAVAFMFWIAIGAGVLIKGPIIVLVIAPAIAMIALRFPEAQPHRSLRPVMGILILLLMIGPWAAAIGAATEGRFFEEAVGADMLAKAGVAQESHSGPPGYHLLLAPLLAWPLAALLPWGLIAAFSARRDFAFWFLLSWLIPGWLIFEFAATKLPHYTLPLFPALAGLAAAAAMKPGRAPSVWRRAGALIYAGAGFALAAATAALPHVFGAPALAIGAGFAALVIAVMTLWASLEFWRGAALKGVAIAVPSGALVAVVLLAGILPRLDDLAVSPRLSAALDDAGLHPLRDGAPPAALAGFYEPSAVFLLGTQTGLGNGAAAADALIDRGGAAIVDGRERASFEARLQERNGAAEIVAEIGGFNYSKGDRIQLTVYRRSVAALSP